MQLAKAVEDSPGRPPSLAGTVPGRARGDPGDVSKAPRSVPFRTNCRAFREAHSGDLAALRAE